jgi:hypothetical protein
MVAHPLKRKLKATFFSQTVDSSLQQNRFRPCIKLTITFSDGGYDIVHQPSLSMLESWNPDESE